MPAAPGQPSDRCSVSQEIFDNWFEQHNTEDVEAIVPDMAGAARGKVVPAAKFADGRMKMPEGVFAQTISGDYVDNPGQRRGSRHVAGR